MLCLGSIVIMTQALTSSSCCLFDRNYFCNAYKSFHKGETWLSSATDACYFGLDRKCIVLNIPAKRPAVSPFTDMHALLVNNRWRCVQRIEQGQTEILHTEIYHQRWPLWFLNLLHNYPRRISGALLKPLAKSGMRRSGSGSAAMDELIRETFPSKDPIEQQLEGIESSATTAEKRLQEVRLISNYSSTSGDERQYKYHVGLLIYMWVNPTLRGANIGEFLLRNIQFECRHQGYSHMLLVHDDQGSGKLVEYYRQRGFVSVESFLPKGMICVL
mmetsp:Transcript_26241/g.43741  ORF Transcript_26241/g.43741 Transcript_26241/m.43741 type:complete len:273 (+) Transcript_26241:2-820(+)